MIYIIIYITTGLIIIEISRRKIHIQSYWKRFNFSIKLKIKLPKRFKNERRKENKTRKRNKKRGQH